MVWEIAQLSDMEFIIYSNAYIQYFGKFYLAFKSQT